MARQGHNVHVIGPYLASPPTAPGITAHRFDRPPIGYRNIVGHGLIVMKMREILQHIPGLDVAHAPEYLSTGIVTPSTRLPVTLTTPGNIYERIAHGNPYDSSTTLVYKLAARSSARACAPIHAISVDQPRWWRYVGASPERTIAFSLGVDLDLFHRHHDARSVLGLHDDELVVLYVGRLSRDKGVRVLLQMLAMLASSHRSPIDRSVTSRQQAESGQMQFGTHERTLIGRS